MANTGGAGQGQRVAAYCRSMDLLDQHYLWASCLWGAIAGGYCIYGWRQRALLPFLGGLAITAASYFILSALWMSLACIALIYLVHWLLKQGY